MRSGCLFLNNRYHDPTLGTFISVDPLVAATGEAYIYASGNPTTLSDPTGLDPDTSAYARERAEAEGNCTYSSGYTCYLDKAAVENTGLYLAGQIEALADDQYSRASALWALPNADDQALINQILDALDEMVITGSGTCAAGSFAAALGVTGSACVINLDTVDNNILALTGGLIAKSNVGAEVDVSTILTNATSKQNLLGASLCFAASGAGLTGSVCGGIADGVFTGTILTSLDLASGSTYVLPVDFSVARTRTWAIELTPRVQKSYRNPDGTCINGSGDYCGQGSPNGGVPTGFP